MPRKIRPLARIRREADNLVERRAKEAAALINELAPYDETRRPDRRGPRHLKGSYRAVRLPDGDWGVVTSKRYWAFVEFGTKEHGNAQPHVRPALDEMARR